MILLKKILDSPFFKPIMEIYLMIENVIYKIKRYNVKITYKENKL